MIRGFRSIGTRYAGSSWHIEGEAASPPSGGSIGLRPGARAIVGGLSMPIAGVAAALVGLLAWAIVVYNRLVASRQRVREG